MDFLNFSISALFFEYFSGDWYIDWKRVSLLALPIFFSIGLRVKFDGWCRLRELLLFPLFDLSNNILTVLAKFVGTHPVVQLLDE